jgi:hypothetical protein
MVVVRPLGANIGFIPVSEHISVLPARLPAKCIESFAFQRLHPELIAFAIAFAQGKLRFATR